MTSPRLHAVQLSLEGRALLDDPNLIVADIRDEERIAEVFASHRPEVVFHAAALKHLSLLEMHPAEGYKTNVWGTQNLLRAAGRFDVERFVNVSTDKAADPTSVLGRTKRLAEQLTAYAADDYPGTYLSVRFGNVLGSRGSVLPAFRAQIEAGGPVTVTDPEVTRYFMTVEEAVQLVIQAGCDRRRRRGAGARHGRAGEDRRCGPSVGGRSRPVDRDRLHRAPPGEKLHEVLFSEGETDDRPRHPLISHCTVPALSAFDVEEIAASELATNSPSTRQRSREVLD